MMSDITITAKTVEEAITEAAIKLEVTSSQLEYEIVEKGSTGFLGLGSKQAVIKARIKEEKAESLVAEEKKEKISEEVNEQVVKEVIEEVPVSSKKVGIEESTKEACVSFLKDTIEAMGIMAEISANIEDEATLSIEMKGPNMGLLIGKRGQTLDALQYLTNRVANKHQEEYIRVKLDTENYRERRKETLENLAGNIANKVRRTRRAVSLEPMNPYERRIIHSALQGDRSVTTHSEGEEPYRKVVVAPVKR